LPADSCYLGDFGPETEDLICFDEQTAVSGLLEIGLFGDLMTATFFWVKGELPCLIKLVAWNMAPQLLFCFCLRSDVQEHSVR
jgi:hypothetical protein